MEVALPVSKAIATLLGAGDSDIARWSTQAALGIAGMRMALGAAALLVPTVAGRAWIGPGASGKDRAVTLRALGGRDVVLGAGALLGAAERDELRRWVALGATSDAVDTIATAVGFGALPKRRRWLVLAASAASASAGLLAAAGLSRERR
jgi:hypothetical protein